MCGVVEAASEEAAFWASAVLTLLIEINVIYST